MNSGSGVEAQSGGAHQAHHDIGPFFNLLQGVLGSPRERLGSQGSSGDTQELRDTTVHQLTPWCFNVLRNVTLFKGILTTRPARRAAAFLKFLTRALRCQLACCLLHKCHSLPAFELELKAV